MVANFRHLKSPVFSLFPPTVYYGQLAGSQFDEGLWQQWPSRSTEISFRHIQCIADLAWSPDFWELLIQRVRRQSRMPITALMSTQKTVNENRYPWIMSMRTQSRWPFKRTPHTSTGVFIGVTEEDVYIHPDLESWMKIIYNGDYTENVFDRLEFFTDVKTSVLASTKTMHVASHELSLSRKFQGDSYWKETNSKFSIYMYIYI